MTTSTHVFDHSRDELVDRVQRIRFDASHVPQLLLVRLLVHLAIEQLLGEVQCVLVVMLSGILTSIYHGYSRGET